MSGIHSLGVPLGQLVELPCPMIKVNRPLLQPSSRTTYDPDPQEREVGSLNQAKNRDQMRCLLTGKEYGLDTGRQLMLTTTT